MQAVRNGRSGTIVTSVGKARTPKPADRRGFGHEYLHRLFTHAKIAFDSRPWRYRLKVRTEPSQGSNPGSSPGIATNIRRELLRAARSGVREILGPAKREVHLCVRKWKKLRASLSLYWMWQDLIPCFSKYCWWYSSAR